MPVKIICPHCHQSLRLPDALYEKPAQCPLCRGGFAVQWRFNPRMLPEVQPAENGTSPRRPCPTCGHQVLVEAVKCPECRAWIKRE